MSLGKSPYPRENDFMAGLQILKINPIIGKFLLPPYTSLEKDMKEAAKKLEFERAAELRDKIKALKEKGMGISS